MSEISKAYEPQAVEDKWYQFWLDGKFFVANENSSKPAYSIVIPPPNVTGVLTMGHVLNNTIQDILARKARMDGKEVLWLPGTDHAGIATQTVVERTLKKAGEIKHRDDLGREKFLERVWQWKEKHGGIIIQQLKKLGASCDWTRERFTMDEDYSRCVQKVFVELYKKGLIYRGKRMVNWCPASLTALSDEEVVMKEQKGFMYHFKVEVAEAPGTFLTIATTRPETIPGDTAVAVNPKDPRYAHLIGKFIVRPLPVELPREQKLIPIVGDEHVDFEFGTGVLKVTPAHDKADFEIGARHKLAAVEVINASGVMSDAAGADLRGLDRFKARKVAVEKLTELGALEKEEPYTNNVGFSERADVPVEPRLSEQWFLKYPSTEKSRAVVENGEMKFHPERWAKVYDHWMGGLQDWCISRQLWWGHRIPVWSKKANEGGPDFSTVQAQLNAFKQSGALIHMNLYTPHAMKVGATNVLQHDSQENYFIRLDVAVDPTEEKIISLLEQNGFTQDPDVLDTWFSSWLWPFATMGWPEKTDTLKKFYPTTDLVTGPDIIFFWVARMIMAGYEYMGELPFKNVYFTGIIRDKQGRKMSKSLGNSPDPLDLIAKYGADALRFGVMRAAPLGQDILFDEQNVELGRNFCNKLWNACRFRQMQGNAESKDPHSETDSALHTSHSAFPVEGEIDPALLTSDDKWILLKLDQAIREVTQALADYKFSDATNTLYRFFWNEYCDWYVEASKAVLGRPTTESSPSPLGGERAGVRGQSASEPSDAVKVSNESVDPSPSIPLPSEGRGRSDAEARKANTVAVIDFVLSHTLRMFQPFVPFIAEELWHGMGYSADMPENQGGKTIMFAPWPKPLDAQFKEHYVLDETDEQFVNTKYDLVTKGRNLRREGNIQSGKKVKFVFKPANQMVPHEMEVLKILLNAESLEVDPHFAPKKGTPAVHTDLGDLFLPMDGLIDVTAERERRTKEKEQILGEIQKVEQKLANPAFTQKVPESVLLEHRKRLADWQAKLKHTLAALEDLNG